MIMHYWKDWVFMLQVDKGKFMYRVLLVVFILFFTGCSYKVDQTPKEDYSNASIVETTQRVYEDITKDALLEAMKKVFILASKDKYLINSYRNHLHIEKINYDYMFISSNISVENWVLEVEEKDKKSYAKLSIYETDKFDETKKRFVDNSLHNLIWDRIDYLLGLKKDWVWCRGYICSTFDFKKTTPTKEDFIKDITITQREEKLKALEALENSDEKKKEQLLKEYGSLIEFDEEKEIEKKEDPESIAIKNEFEEDLKNKTTDLKKFEEVIK
ncbi:hypothetical protein CRU99_03925 [Malaciobacter mytili]|nr:hypothetical protein CRU99_03925 [Malaciobacter mytili]